MWGGRPRPPRLKLILTLVFYDSHFCFNVLKKLMWKRNEEAKSKAAGENVRPTRQLPHGQRESCGVSETRI